MCGRYTLAKPKLIKKRFNTLNSIEDFEGSYNIAPSQTLPVIIRKSPNSISMMRWGFTPVWSRDRKFSFINIRRETFRDKPYFKNTLLTRRCLVPSDGFYEWRKARLKRSWDKIPYYIYLKDRPLFSFAGVYSSFPDAEGMLYETFAIITCPPNRIVKPIHNRMPVILDKNYEEVWLEEKSTFNTLLKYLEPFPPARMEAYPVSKKVNNPRNDEESLIKETAYPQS